MFRLITRRSVVRIHSPLPLAIVHFIATFTSAIFSEFVSFSSAIFKNIFSSPDIKSRIKKGDYSLSRNRQHLKIFRVGVDRLPNSSSSKDAHANSGSLYSLSKQTKE